MKKAFLVIVLIFADQLLKYLAKENLLPAMGGVFHFVCNPLLSWGIPLTGVFFWLSWIAIFILLLTLIKKTGGNIFLVITLAGAISNFIDRVFHDCVIDYISISSFPIFNLADILIVGGIFIFALKNIFKKKISS